MVRNSDRMRSSNRFQTTSPGAPEPERYLQQRFMRIITIVTLLISISANASIIERGRGILFGVDHAFAVTAKSGWVLDDQSGANQGLHMVFYPKGETWSESPVVIYGRAISTTEAASVKSQVERTVNQFRRNGSPNHSSEAQAPLTLPSGNKAELYLFSGDQWGNYEAVAYFQETKTINFLVFNARTKENFDKYIGDFHKIISSYQNLYKSPATNARAKLNRLKRESSSILAKPGGKEYESKAVQAIGQTMASTMRDCTSYLGNKELPAFSYFVRIDRKGNIHESDIFPTNALSVCFSALMSAAKYPAHAFKYFLLNIEMKPLP